MSSYENDQDEYVNGVYVGDDQHDDDGIDDDNESDDDDSETGDDNEDSDDVSADDHDDSDQDDVSEYSNDVSGDDDDLDDDGSDDLTDDSKEQQSDSGSGDTYTFNIVDGVVVSISEYDDDGSVETETPERNEAYTLDGADVIKTETKLTGQEITRYALNADGFYVKASSLFMPLDGNANISAYLDTPDTYTFNVVDGAIVSVTELDDDGSTKTEYVEADESYAFDGTDVLKTEDYAAGQEVTRYVLNADGVYVKASTQWTADGAQANGTFAPTLTMVLDYEGSKNDDIIAVSLSQSALGGAGSDQFVIRDIGHLVIQDFSDTDNDSLVFDTGLGLTSVEQLARYVTGIEVSGQDLIVEFGADISITIVGGVTSGIDWDDVVVLS